MNAMRNYLLTPFEPSKPLKHLKPSELSQNSES